MPLARHAPLALDLAWRDLAQALLAALGPQVPEPLPRLAPDEDPPLVAFSVRSGLDLYLAAAGLPRGGRVLVGALTHPDMLSLLRCHGLVPVAVDLDPATLAPLPGALARGWTSDTVAVLVTHLFGARIPLDEAVRFCQERGLPLVEDCAQAFTRREDGGHPAAVVSLFSFGPLKTSTALGGALLYVRDPALRRRMEEIQDRWPAWSRGGFLLRILRYAAVHLVLSHPLLFGLLARLVEASGRDVMAVTRSWASGMPGPFRPERFRTRPSAGLVRFLARRLREHDPGKVAERARCGEEAVRALPALEPPGREGRERTWWILPVSADRPGELLRRLERAGFQGIPGLSNLVAAENPADPPRQAQRILERSLLVPLRPGLPAGERRRLLQLLREP